MIVPFLEQCLGSGNMVDDLRIFLIKIPAVLSNVYLVSVQKKLSISVPFRSENLVGNVIWGKRLNEVSMSKKLLQCSCSFILSMFML